MNIRHKYNRCIGNTNGHNNDNKPINNSNNINSIFIDNINDSELSRFVIAVHIIPWTLLRGLITRVLTLQASQKHNPQRAVHLWHIGICFIMYLIICVS